MGWTKMKEEGEGFARVCDTKSRLVDSRGDCAHDVCNYIYIETRMQMFSNLGRELAREWGSAAIAVCVLPPRRRSWGRASPTPWRASPSGTFVCAGPGGHTRQAEYSFSSMPSISARLACTRVRYFYLVYCLSGYESARK